MKSRILIGTVLSLIALVEYVLPNLKITVQISSVFNQATDLNNKKKPVFPDIHR
ncbi:hypothetical protein [Yeosuana marina]|uniref:hypothetical protein n=1 Tax=Yeosuana marina TaxID=1565536 RepID=UPI00141DE66B|nr:hypothetical protein [Yeosuana marina]